MDFIQKAKDFLSQNESQLNADSNFAAAGIRAIKNNDSKAGEELAMNILRSYGLSVEQAMSIAKQRGLIQ